MPKVFFENVKTGKRYKVLKLDKEKGTVLIEGKYGNFEEPYTKERLQKLGYTVVVEKDEEAA